MKPQRARALFRMGRLKPVKGKSILICIAGRPSKWVENFVEHFSQVNPRENIYFVDKGALSSPILKSGNCLPYPYAIIGATARYLRKLRTTLILVDDGVSPPRNFLRRAERDQITTAFVGDHASPGRRDPGRTPAFPEGGSPLVTTGLLGVDAAEAVQSFSPVIARETIVHVKLKKRIRFFLWRHVLFRLNKKNLRQLSSFDDINEALGRPNAILCLGNGPSSEDPDLKGITPDSVFRVNHRWLGEGLFTSPDVVFSGAVETLLKIRKEALYVFINHDRSMRMINKARKTIPRLSFCNAEDLGFPLGKFFPYQPTNGLIMLYLAVNLTPATLTVAGVDLFSDPRGAYPDDNTIPNTYTSAHNRKLELEILLKLLASYRGELTIIGDQLKSAFEHYQCENALTT